MAKSTLVVIGGDAAGMSAASQARRRDSDREIIVYERGEYTSYAACGIPYLAGGLIARAEQLIARRPETFRARYNIQVHTEHEVIAIEPTNQRVRVRRLQDGHLFWQPYDDLLIATGALPIIPQIEGITAEGVFAIRDLASGIALTRYLQESRPRHAVVIGGGYVGLEMADALRMLQIETALIDLAPQVMPSLDPEMAALVAQALEEIGVRLYLQEELLEIQVTKGRVQGIRTNQRTLPADVVILGIGVRPNSELAGTAGISLGVRGAIRVNPYMQTNIPHIWAAGDCIESVHRVSGARVFTPLGTVANKTGRIAGLNITGDMVPFPGVLGTAITKVGHTEIARTGLQSRECAALGLDYATAQIDTTTRAGYYPETAPITVRLLAERGTGRLLGGQIVGGPGAGKRIDTIAAALTARQTVQDLIDMDLAYAPPFSPVWDPVQTAARVLARE